jgi:methylglutaconyl-CoA hydratase
MSDLLVEHDGSVARVTLNRPEAHNAFNATLIADLASAFAALSADPTVRVVVLAGAGPSFCAGADVRWMQQSLTYTEEQNLLDAQRLSLMLRTIDECAKPVVALV